MDWAAQTTSFLSRPFPGAPAVGQIEVVFTNAINGNTERRPCRDVDEARQLAAEYRPFNNTRVAAYRVVSVNLGIPSWEQLDLAATAAPAAHPAALARAFDPPGPPRPGTDAAAPSTGRAHSHDPARPPSRTPRAPRR
jgi:hypothetical protein